MYLCELAGYGTSCSTGARPRDKFNGRVICNKHARRATPLTTATERGKTMETATATTVDSAKAAELYNSGMTVLEVANELGVNYLKARTAIRAGGSEVRDPSARLKGRPRKSTAASA